MVIFMNLRLMQSKDFVVEFKYPCSVLGKRLEPRVIGDVCKSAICASLGTYPI